MNGEKFMKLKKYLSSVLAFFLLGAAVTSAFVLSSIDHQDETVPDENTKIRLYGEAHGQELYYDIEFNLWHDLYEKGYRSLFVELPYYTGEFLNLWMKDDSDKILNQIFKDIEGTLSGNDFYKAFFKRIKAECPDTVFYGTDVGHQNESTGIRYLKYLEDNDLADSQNYKLTEINIKQGNDFYSDPSRNNAFSAVRENYMVENFINAYSRCNSEKIMGIYGSAHLNLQKSDLMAGKLQAHYGKIISSQKISTFAFGENKAYRIGFSVTGFIFLLMLLIPNIYWAKKAKPENYEEESKKENKVLLFFERAGETLVTTALVIFPAINPYIKILPEGLFFDWKIIIWLAAFVLMILYEAYWIKYFKSSRTLRDQYSSFAGFPLAGASLPVISVILLGLYSGNLIILGSAVILGIGHIGIHWMHRRNVL